MKVLIKRLHNNKNETIGIMFVNDIEECWILEDQKQEGKKVYGETRIPAGVYKIELRTEGRLHDKYKKKFPSFHKGMLHIKNIPGFTYVYIHIGNTDDDTLGCPLTGKLASIQDGNIITERSTEAYEKLYKKVVWYAENDSLFLEIKDEN